LGEWLESRLARQRVVEGPDGQVARPQQSTRVESCVLCCDDSMVVGEKISDRPRKAKSPAMKWEEPNWLAALLDYSHINVMVSTGGGRGELRMEVGTQQVRIALPELLPPLVVRGGELRRCNHFDVHLCNA
jgi:hypothetical protein